MCGGCELMWSGGVVWHGELVEKLAQGQSKQKKMTTAAVDAVTGPEANPTYTYITCGIQECINQ